MRAPDLTEGSVTLVNHYGDDLMVVNFARESTGRVRDQLDDQDVKFITYLAREQHIAPFFHPKISLRIEIPFFLARQWDKHRIGTSRLEDFSDMSEKSRRYVTKGIQFYKIAAWNSAPDKSIKQGSGEPLSKGSQSIVQDVYESFLYNAESAYNAMLHYGVAPEQARAVLPVSTMTSWIETGSLHYWARMCDLRRDSHAQKEIQVYAEQISTIISELFPHSWPALLKHAPTAMKNRLQQRQ